MKVSIFRPFGLKASYHARKNEVLGRLNPLNGWNINETPKDTSLRETASFDVFCVKIGAVVLVVGDWKNQKTTSGVDGKVAHAQKGTRFYLIWMKFCMLVAIPDVITYTNFGYYRLRGLGWRGSNFAPHFA